MNPKRTFRYYYLKFIRLQGDPQSLARGFGIGIFLGITPIIPFHTLLNIIVTFITRTSTIASLLASVIVCNPLTYIPQYYLSTIIGNAVTPYNFTWERMQVVLNFLLSKPGIMESIKALTSLGYEAVVVLLAGGVILAMPFTIVGYFLSLRLFIKIRQKRKSKQILT